MSQEHVQWALFSSISQDEFDLIKESDMHGNIEAHSFYRLYVP